MKHCSAARYWWTVCSMPLGEHQHLYHFPATWHVPVAHDSKLHICSACIMLRADSTVSDVLHPQATHSVSVSKLQALQAYCIGCHHSRSAVALSRWTLPWKIRFVLSS